MSRSSKRVRGQMDRLFDNFDRKQDKAKKLEIQLQMKRLNADEARLDRKNGWKGRKRA